MAFIARLVLLAVLAVLAAWWSVRTGGPAPPTLPETLVVAVPRTERTFPAVSPYGPGLERDALRMFAEAKGLAWEMIPTDTWPEALALVKTGKARAAISPGLPPDAGNHPAKGLEAGPAYGSSRPVVLHHFLRLDMENPDDMCEVAVFVQNTPGVRGAFTDMERKVECSPKTVVMPGTAALGPSLPMLDANTTVRFTLVDKGLYALWQPFHSRLRPTLDLPGAMPLRWYWRDSPKGLGPALASFWGNATANGTVAKLKELYTGFLPERTDYYQLYHLRQIVRTKVPVYARMLARAAARYDLDPLFLAAVVYQESHFDVGAQSRTGVKGLMQITQATADHLGLADRTAPAASIMAGARYLRTLWHMLGDKGLAPWDRWFFALAAYNQGYGHVRDAMALAERTGRDPASWLDVKEVFPLLAWKRYYDRSEFGYTRGWEGVEYVDKVRYYYYVLFGLAVLPGPEAQKLAPLAGARPAAWP